jgi:LPXTG-site transpeptidase (sortase) family protein
MGMQKKTRERLKVGGLTLLALVLFSGAYFHNDIINFFSNNPSVTVISSPEPVVKTGPTTVTLPEAIAASPIPVVYADTFEEAKVQDFLKQGAVILPLGTTLGQPGNVVITAHSSGFESYGPYRFAFQKLENISNGQEFTVNTPQATYTYKVYQRDIVWPTQIDKLPKDDRSTVTLVTCWPNWTNLKRLLIDGELIKTELHK